MKRKKKEKKGNHTPELYITFIVAQRQFHQNLCISTNLKSETEKKDRFFNLTQAFYVKVIVVFYFGKIVSDAVRHTKLCSKDRKKKMKKFTRKLITNIK